MARGFIPSILVSLLMAAAASSALDMEYISPELKRRLADDFERAKGEKTDGFLDRKWACDMYGVRSRLQVQRGIKLYHLTKDASGLFKNSGAQPVKDYTSQGNGLQGQNDRFEDQVRMTTDGQLISKLTVLKPKPMVVAYSVCKLL